MFPARYFPNRFFAPRYWPKVGGEVVAGVTGPYYREEPRTFTPGGLEPRCYIAGGEEPRVVGIG